MSFLTNSLPFGGGTAGEDVLVPGAAGHAAHVDHHPRSQQPRQAVLVSTGGGPQALVMFRVMFCS